MEKTEITLGNRVVPLSIRHSRSARRMTIRISPAKNGVTMTLPRRISIASGLRFLHSKSDWVLANLEADEALALTDGAVIPVLGKEYRIRRMDGRGSPRLGAGEIIIHCQPEFTARRVKDFLRNLMLEICTERVHTVCRKINKTCKKIVITKAGARWGSCNSRGIISLNGLLIFAPQHILDYVIAHEVAHLIEMNHSPRFWRHVEQLFPNAKEARGWLKKEGHRLHRYE